MKKPDGAAGVSGPIWGTTLVVSGSQGPKVIGLVSSDRGGPRRAVGPMHAGCGKCAGVGGERGHPSSDRRGGPAPWASGQAIRPSQAAPGDGRQEVARCGSPPKAVTSRSKPSAGGRTATHVRDKGGAGSDCSTASRWGVGSGSGRIGTLAAFQPRQVEGRATHSGGRHRGWGGTESHSGAASSSSIDSFASINRACPPSQWRGGLGRGQRRAADSRKAAILR